MYYTRASLLFHEYETVQRLRPTDDQVSDKHVYLPNEVSIIQNVPVFRVFNGRWWLLAVHECTHPLLGYEFIVTILCQYRNNRRTIWRIHHPQRVPFVCITSQDSTRINNPSPCVLFHFRDILDRQKTQPLDDYLNTLPYEIIVPDDFLKE